MFLGRKSTSETDDLKPIEEDQKSLSVTAEKIAESKNDETEVFPDKATNGGKDEKPLLQEITANVEENKTFPSIESTTLEIGENKTPFDDESEENKQDNTSSHGSDLVVDTEEDKMVSSTQTVTNDDNIPDSTSSDVSITKINKKVSFSSSDANHDVENSNKISTDTEEEKPATEPFVEESQLSFENTEEERTISVQIAGENQELEDNENEAKSDENKKDDVQKSNLNPSKAVMPIATKSSPFFLKKDKVKVTTDEINKLPPSSKMKIKHTKPDAAEQSVNKNPKDVKQENNTSKLKPVVKKKHFSLKSTPMLFQKSQVKVITDERNKLPPSSKMKIVSTKPNPIANSENDSGNEEETAE